MNYNFSTDYINRTKMSIFETINEIVDTLSNIDRLSNSLFSLLSEFSSNDRTVIDKCGQYNLYLTKSRTEINNNLDEFLSIIDTYIQRERDADGYCNHVLSNITDELSSIDQDIASL